MPSIRLRRRPLPLKRRSPRLGIGWSRMSDSLTPLVVRCAALRHTRSAAAFPPPAVRIQIVVRMAIRALRLGAVDSAHRVVSVSRVICSSIVLSVTDRLQMHRVHTSSYSAEMVEFRSIRNGSDDQAVGDTVCPAHRLIDPEPAISLGIEACCPQPAIARLVDFLPEALFQRADRHARPAWHLSMIHDKVVDIHHRVAEEK